MYTCICTHVYIYMYMYTCICIRLRWAPGLGWHGHGLFSLCETVSRRPLLSLSVCACVCVCVPALPATVLCYWQALSPGHEDTVSAMHNLGR